MPGVATFHFGNTGSGRPVIRGLKAPSFGPTSPASALALFSCRLEELMMKRFMLVLVGWIGGTLMGWYMQRLTGWHFPLYLGFVTSVLALVAGGSSGKGGAIDPLARKFSLFSSERRHG